MVIEKIGAADTYPLRSLVLRNWDESTPCPFPDDDKEGTIHFALRLGAKPVCIASFYEKPYGDLPPRAIQLRGMATHPNHRGAGLGRDLVVQAIKYFKEREYEVIWCNARIAALGFYEKLDFKIIGDEFEIPGIGKHYVMALYLND